MTSTETKPHIIDEAEAVEELDWHHKPVCEMVLTAKLFMVVRIPIKRCRKEAKWMTTCPGCAKDCYACQGHRKSVLETFCPRCGFEALPDAWNWIPLT